MTNINKVLRVQVLRLAWPVILEMSGVMLTGAITTAMVGRLGAVELSAVGIATMVQMASAMVVSGFGTGASALVGRESGAGQWDEVRKTTGQALLLGVLLGPCVEVYGRDHHVQVVLDIVQLEELDRITRRNIKKTRFDKIFKIFSHLFLRT